MPDTSENITPEVGRYPDTSRHSSLMASCDQSCKVIQDHTLTLILTRALCQFHAAISTGSGSKWAGSVTLKSVETSTAPTYPAAQ